jgi:hypothetical protein
METKSATSTKAPFIAHSPASLNRKHLIEQAAKKALTEAALSKLHAKFGVKKPVPLGKAHTHVDGLRSALAEKLKTLKDNKAKLVSLVQLSQSSIDDAGPSCVFYMQPRFFEGPVTRVVQTSPSEIPSELALSRAAVKLTTVAKQLGEVELELPTEDADNLLAYQTGDFYLLLQQEISKLQDCISDICTKLPEKSRRGKKFMLPFLSRLMTRSLEAEPAITPTHKEVLIRQAGANRERLMRNLLPSPALDLDRLDPFVFKRSKANVTNSLQLAGQTQTSLYKTPAYSSKVAADDFTTTHGEITKYGYLVKRRALTLKFHRRWVVLRGFKLYWYRKATSSTAKGMIYLSPLPIIDLQVSKEKCFALERSPGVRLVFLLDGNSYPWKVLLHNQIAYRRYIDQAASPKSSITDFFRDVSCTELVVKDEPLSEVETGCLAEGMIAHNRLQILVLENCSLGDADFCRLIEACVGCSKLETLRVTGNMLTSQSVQAITLLIKQEESQWNCLTNIDLSKNPIKDEGLELLTRALLIRFRHLYWPKAIHVVPFFSLELADCALTDLSLHLVCDLFSKTIEISQAEETIDPSIKLNLSKNEISSMFVPYLSQILRTFQGFYSLGLADCRLTSDDCSVLALALRTNSSLIEFDLRGAPIEYEAACEFIDTLKMNFTLTKLLLTLNPELCSALAEKSKEIGDSFRLKDSGL